MDPMRQEKPLTPRMIEIIRLLQDNLLLVGPTLNFVKGKMAEINSATLQVLYSQEQLEELRKQMEESER